MKRFISFLLAFTMLAGMGGSFADAEDEGKGKTADYLHADGKASFPIKASYVAEPFNPTYFVTVSWNDLSFEVGVDGELKWDTGHLQYDDSRSLVVRDTSAATITVTNRSDVGVSITSTLEQKENDFGLYVYTTDSDFSVTTDRNGKWKTKELYAGTQVEGQPTQAATAQYNVKVGVANSKPDFNSLKFPGPEDPLIPVGSVTIVVNPASGS